MMLLPFSLIVDWTMLTISLHGELHVSPGHLNMVIVAVIHHYVE